MKMPVIEVMEKLESISTAIRTVEKHISAGAFEGQEPLYDVIGLLDEYRNKILATKVEI